MANATRPCDTETDRLSEWENRWQEGKIPSHVQSVNQLPLPAVYSLGGHGNKVHKLVASIGVNIEVKIPLDRNLINNFEKLADPGQKGLSFLLPLCGKTMDLKWIADKGFEVTGIEGVTKACEDFFSEQGVKYAVSDIPEISGGKLFKSEDDKIKIYNCDIFNLNKDILGQFDVVWDRGSIVVISIEDRQSYINIMKSVVKPAGKILLEVVEYDWNERKTEGPPYPFLKDDLDKLYGNWCTIEEVGRHDWLHKNLARFQEQWGLSAIDNVQYFIKVISTT